MENDVGSGDLASDLTDDDDLTDSAAAKCDCELSVKKLLSEPKSSLMRELIEEIKSQLYDEVLNKFDERITKCEEKVSRL